MTRNEKIEAMNAVDHDINKAKDSMNRAADELYDRGLITEAEAIMAMVYKLERIQNRYN